MLENRYEIVWSIYVAGKDPSKACRTQLTEIERRIRLVPEKWELFVEEENPTEVRICGVVSLNGLTRREAAFWALGTLGRLSNHSWEITGLSTIDNDERALYLMGLLYNRQPEHFPALTNVMFELQQLGDDYSDPFPGQIVPPPHIKD